MLNAIDRFGVGGVIEAEREGVSKRVHVSGRCVVHASSSDINDSLGSYLLRSGQLSSEDYSATMKEREAGKRRYGVILVEAGLLSPGEVARAIRKQVEAIVWSLFYWQDGRVSFKIGDPGGGGIRLPMRHVILQGIQRAPNAKALVARLGQRSTVFAPTDDTEGIIDAGLDSEQFDLLRLVDGSRSLYEICTAGPFSAAENAKLMYAFQVLQLIRRPALEENEPQESKSEPETSSVKIRLKTPGGRFSG